MDLKNVRLCLVGPLPPPAGGMAVLTEQLGDLLRQEGLDVRFVQVNAPYRPLWISNFQGVRAVFRLVPYLLTLWREIGRAQIVHLMANSGWSWYLYAVPALWISAWRGVPIVVNYHGGEAELFLQKAAARVRKQLGPAQAMLVPSNFLVDIFGRYGISARVLPNVVDLSRFSPSARSHRDPACPHLIVARNLEFIYGGDIALRAFAEIAKAFPGARLTITGSGPEQAQWASLARDLRIDDSVVFPGRLNREQMSALFKDADVLLNPSRADNQPGAILEAMASGVPVVAAAVGGVPYMLEHEKTALLVPSEAPRALADAALSLLRDPERAQRIARAALADVQRHDWTSVRCVLFDEYKRTMGFKLATSHLGRQDIDAA